MSQISSGSAISTSAAQSRFRLQSPNSQPRNLMIVALDDESAGLGRILREQSWRAAAFFNFDGFGTDSGWQAALNWRSFDLIVMVGTVGANLDLAKTIGSKGIACGIKVSSVLLGAAASDMRKMSASLLELRPWSRTLTVMSSQDDLCGLLHALGA